MTSSRLRSLSFRRGISSVGLVLLLASIAVVSLAAQTSAAASPKTLLALGDSLAAGYQPSVGSSLPPVDPTSGYRDQGYPGSYPADLASTRGLSLIDLGCPGETTESMLAKPAQSQCARLYSTEFSATSQLVAAQTFLSRHKGEVALVTIDIGANDLDHCVSVSAVNASCLKSSDVAIEKNLRSILGPLASSVHRDDPKARLVAMNYYDPFLGLAFTPGGTQGVKLASVSLAATDVLNGQLAVTYRAFGFATANTASAFQSNAELPLSRYRGKLLPPNVIEVCNLTWMCPVQSGQSPDIHPNLAGYRSIAAAFEKTLDA